MPDSAEWLIRLSTIAPDVDLVTLRLIASLLARKVSSDVLLSVGDALDEVIKELMWAGNVRRAGQIVAIAGILDREVTSRHLLRGDFW